MADLLNAEIAAEIDLPNRQPDLTTSSLSLNLHESDPGLEQVSLEPPLPAPLPPVPLPLPLPPSAESHGYSLMSSIREKLAQTGQNEPSSSWKAVSIFRVPNYLRDIDETAFTPQLVSLGPYHCGLQHLQDMNSHKVRALQCALGRTGQNVDIYFDAVRSLEDRARACYGAPLSISSEDFIATLVLDSIFVLELFRGAFNGFSLLGYAPNDPVFTNFGLIHTLRYDMLKLENQLPLFILDRILALQLNLETSCSIPVASFAFQFFHSLRPSAGFYSYLTLDDPFLDIGISGALHSLDFFHDKILKIPKRTEKRVCFFRYQANVRCVTELRVAGIKFQCRNGRSFWDLYFKDGILNIPMLYIHEGTKSLFLNLIAFEQCHSLKCSSQISSYVVLMKCLINTEVDVGYLQDAGIFQNWLGNHVDVVDLFDQLGQAVRLGDNDYYFIHLSSQINRHCQHYRRWNVWKATFIRKYLSNPWTCISLVGAVLLLLLTFAQTFYTIYAYYKPIR